MFWTVRVRKRQFEFERGPKGRPFLDFLLSRRFGNFVANRRFAPERPLEACFGQFESAAKLPIGSSAAELLIGYAELCAEFERDSSNSKEDPRVGPF